MAITRAEKQIVWSASSSISIAASGNATSDAFVFEDNAIGASIAMKANNSSGTIVQGDTVDVYFLPTCGDPDGSSSDEYATTNHGHFLCTLDMNLENPAIKVVEIPTTAKGGKIYAKSNDSSASVTFSATIYEQLAA